LGHYGLAADKPDEAEEQARSAIEAWACKGYSRQHYNLTLALLQTSLYRGDAEAAWERISTSWAAIRRSFIFRIGMMRTEMSYLRAP
jgi:hypothetical protein